MSVIPIDILSRFLDYNNSTHHRIPRLKYHQLPLSFANEYYYVDLNTQAPTRAPCPTWTQNFSVAFSSLFQSPQKMAAVKFVVALLALVAASAYAQKITFPTGYEPFFSLYSR